MNYFCEMKVAIRTLRMPWLEKLLGDIRIAASAFWKVKGLSQGRNVRCCYTDQYLLDVSWKYFNGLVLQLIPLKRKSWSLFQHLVEGTTYKDFMYNLHQESQGARFSMNFDWALLVESLRKGVVNYVSGIV